MGSYGSFHPRLNSLPFLCFYFAHSHPSTGRSIICLHPLLLPAPFSGPCTFYFPASSVPAPVLNTCLCLPLAVHGFCFPLHMFLSFPSLCSCPSILVCSYLPWPLPPCSPALTTLLPPSSYFIQIRLVLFLCCQAANRQRMEFSVEAFFQHPESQDGTCSALTNI